MIGETHERGGGEVREETCGRGEVRGKEGGEEAEEASNTEIIDFMRRSECQSIGLRTNRL